MDLYVRDVRATVEIITASAPARKCFSASRVTGEVKGIYWDQQRRTVPWEMVALPAYCRSPEVDSRHNEMIPGHEPTLDDLRYDIANAMNRTLQDRGFSRYARQLLIGRWIASGSGIAFAPDGSYAISGDPVALPFSPPKEGRWSLGGNMLHLMTKENDQGSRVALVSISEAEVRFHGRGGALFHTYTRRA